ncbi:MAG: hypothetical protein AAF963_01450 [Bacteroidota bacterium]
MKKLVFTLLLITTLVPTWAQEAQNDLQAPAKSAPLQAEQTEKHKVPLRSLNATPLQLPNYGSLVIDWGFSFLQDCPQAIDWYSLGSRFSNVAGYYNIRLGKSHFILSVGAGLEFDRYHFKQQEKTSYHTLVRKDEKDRHTAFQDARKLLPKSQEILQSTLDASYLDILIVELRFNANKKYPKEGFFAAIGGRLGKLLNPSTTIKYKEDDETKQRTLWESFNLESIRYGAHCRIGWGRISIFYNYIVSPLFQKDKGPGKTTTMPHKVGLSVDLF